MIQTDTEKTSRIKPWGFSVEKMTNGEGFITERSKYLPVILERSEESRHRLEILNVFLCRILRSL